MKYEQTMYVLLRKEKMLTTLSVSGYRSIRDLTVSLDRLNVVTGGNGSGKSNLYRALRLLASISQGNLFSILANEGGFHSALWAGPEQFSRAMKAGDAPIQKTVRKEPVSLRLGFSSEDYGYAIDLGHPMPSRTEFTLDPEIKAEAAWVGQVLRPSTTVAIRKGPLVQKVDFGNTENVMSNIDPFDSMMSQAVSPQAFPILAELRARMRSWRFYDHFRTDHAAPARQSQIGTRTPVLSDDGADLAAALQTIIEIGDVHALQETVHDAFPEHRIEVISENGRFEVAMHQRGLLRSLRASELSDGTLRYLLLAAALLTPRPPELMVLNEPETSLHVDLLPSLARLIVRASQNTQIIVISHSSALVNHLRKAEATCFTLRKDLGETHLDSNDKPRWAWPTR